MSGKHEYWVSRSEAEPMVQNNLYLLPIVEVTMYQMVGQNNQIPRLRTSNRGKRIGRGLIFNREIKIGTTKSYPLFGR